MQCIIIETETVFHLLSLSLCFNIGYEVLKNTFYVKMTTKRQTGFWFSPPLKTGSINKYKHFDFILKTFPNRKCAKILKK